MRNAARLADSGKLRSRVAPGTFSLDDADMVHEVLRARADAGKLIIGVRGQVNSVSFLKIEREGGYTTDIGWGTSVLSATLQQSSHSKRLRKARESATYFAAAERTPLWLALCIYLAALWMCPHVLIIFRYRAQQVNKGTNRTDVAGPIHVLIGSE